MAKTMKPPITNMLAASCLAAYAMAAEVPYKGYKADLEMLRDHAEVGGGDGKVIVASSGKAVAAAHRLFKNVSFLFKSRTEVLAVLGHPGTVSDYGVKMEKDPNAPMVFRFDTGYGGAEYRLKFLNNKVYAVEYGGLY